MENDYEKAREWIADADGVIISASNGLSISEGLNIFTDDDAFEELFGDMKRRYGLTCILHDMQARWPTEETKWAFLSRLIKHYCIDYRPTGIMNGLKTLIGNKDYFIITSNGECHFELSGFSEDKIYEIEGSWLRMRCASACHDTLYPVMNIAKDMAEAERNGCIPSELVPHCPRCGGYMEISMGLGAYPDKQKAFSDFISNHHGKRIVVLELGIGWRNQLIKAPLMRLVDMEKNYSYISINKGELFIPASIEKRSIGFNSGISDAINHLIR